MSDVPPNLPPEVVRAPYIFFRLRDIATMELRALLRGELRQYMESSLEVIGPFSGVARPASISEVEFLAAIPVDERTSVQHLLASTEVEEPELSRMLDEGLLIGDDDSRWRARSALPWHSVAALFHVSCLHEKVGAPGTASRLGLEKRRRQAEADVETFIEEHGPPPAAVLRYRTPPGVGAPEGGPPTRLELPVDPAPDDEFFRTLSRRRTWRHFEKVPLDGHKMSTLLRWTFGVHARVHLGAEYSVPLKTSPSGGATHPIEAFPLVMSVEGVEPGVYHYDSYGHTLEPLCRAPEGAVRNLAAHLASGQEFAGDAALTVLLVARLGRNFWKYPNRCRTFAVIHQDAGHLGQTFYLTSTRLGLGAYYTAAVSGSVARDVLGVDDSRDAPMGLCGCGVPSAAAENWLEPRPYLPRTSAMPSPVEIRSPGGSSAARPRSEDAESAPQFGEAFAGEGYFRDLRLSPAIEKE